MGELSYNLSIESKQKQSFNQTYNSSTRHYTKMRRDFAESAKKNDNFWRDHFKDLDSVETAIRCIRPDTEVYSWVKGDVDAPNCLQLSKGCPVCGSRDCFTITMNDDGYFIYKCWEEGDRPLVNGKKTRNGLPYIFGLLLGVDQGRAKGVRVDALAVHLFV